MDINRKKQAIAQTNETCSNMVDGIRQLRLTVIDLFTTLADNGPDPNRNHRNGHESFFGTANRLYLQQSLSKLATQHTLCTSSTPPLRIQKHQEQQQQLDLIQCVNQMISSIASTIKSLDQDVNILIQNSSLINPGESIHLAMDGSAEKHNLYADLCSSYKTFTRLHDYSTHCHALMLQQSLKRVHHRRLESAASNSSQQTRDSSRGDSVVATFNPYTPKVFPAKATIVNMLESCLKGWDTIDGLYSQPFGISTGVFQISVNRVLKAILVMRGIVIDAVIVKAHHESFAIKSSGSRVATGLLIEPGGGSFVDSDDDIDLWSESKYAIFRRLTYHANAAVLHFQYPTRPDIAVKSFLAWFSSYQDLFAAICHRCNSRLRKFMPPICRDFSTGFHPYHDSCK